jgi:2-amino-4-hydroxy-6-hydroxymethyldihydropteridine diphosphokinase
MPVENQLNKSCMTNIALALGSNMGDRLALLRAAVGALAASVTITKVSPIYETAPIYATDQPAFLNGVVLGETLQEPLELLRTLKELEIKLGREPSFRYGPRLIDIDILFYGNRILALPELTLPHPRMAEREFVLRPLADIAPDWEHPHTGLSVVEMLARVPDTKPACLGPLL